jgi:3-hydroxyisobutyrate dehydrogenase
MMIGFVGLGVMGAPMAANLVRSSASVVVWNRSAEKCEPLRALGATVAPSSAALFEEAETVIVMLADERAIDDVLLRRGPRIGAAVDGRTIVNMGTTSPSYSLGLEAAITAAGGKYVEAPVSGSRKPAEDGELVGLLSGEDESVGAVRPLLQSICAETFPCGAVPRALLTKLAVNLFLITMVTGLAEATHFAERHRLDLELFRRIVDAGPMASSLSRMKLAKMVESDFGVQASVTNVHTNTRLVVEAAREAGASSPLIDVCHALYTETAAAGLGTLDMVAVIEAVRTRSVS